jgi:hypothetical protein
MIAMKRETVRKWSYNGICQSESQDVNHDVPPINRNFDINYDYAVHKATASDADKCLVIRGTRNQCSRFLSEDLFCRK